MAHDAIALPLLPPLSFTSPPYGSSSAAAFRRISASSTTP